MTILFIGLLLVAIIIVTSKKTIDKLKKEVEDSKEETSDLNGKLERYSKIINLEEEEEKQKQQNVKILKEINENKERALKLFDKASELEKEIFLLEESSSLQEYAYYKPKYHFEDLKEYKDTLDNIKAHQKNMIKDKTAAYCTTEWNVEGSKSKGRAMTNDNLKAMLRCFNGECEAAISKVKYNNVHTMEKRIEKSFEMINKLNKRNACFLSEIYLDLKLEELHLNHEYHQKQQEIKEEERAIREQMREEEKAQREYEKARKDAEKEEKLALKALEKAKIDLEGAHGAKVDKLNEKLRLLQERLDKAKEMGLRATSMAEVTKAGHVYVISNVGSFGENIFKIGMTRRLIPEERVKELGGASVPFKFDIHAMIYSDNAPGLEKLLHKEFDQKKINRVNSRKEFFNVTLKEIEKVVKINNSKIIFTHVAEAEEYRESIAIKNEIENKIPNEEIKSKEREDILFA